MGPVLWGVVMPPGDGASVCELAAGFLGGQDEGSGQGLDEACLAETRLVTVTKLGTAQ